MISEGTGYVAEGCNEWNESISAAIQDYEDHVVPILERDETFEIMIWTIIFVRAGPARSIDKALKRSSITVR